MNKTNKWHTDAYDITTNVQRKTKSTCRENHLYNNKKNARKRKKKYIRKKICNRINTLTRIHKTDTPGYRNKISHDNEHNISTADEKQSNSIQRKYIMRTKEKNALTHDNIYQHVYEPKNNMQKQKKTIQKHVDEKHKHTCIRTLYQRAYEKQLTCIRKQQHIKKKNAHMHRKKRKCIRYKTTTSRITTH